MGTKLEIVKHVMRVLGETPVNSLASGHPTAEGIEEELDELDREIQGYGWWYNVERLTLVRDISGEVIIPSTALVVDPVDTLSTLVQRGGKLYDTKNQTFSLDDDIEIHLITQVDILDLPVSMYNYIKHFLAYDTFLNDDGDENKLNRLEKRYFTAWIQLKQDDLKNSDVNTRNSPTVAALKFRLIQRGGGTFDPTFPGGGR